MRTYMVAGVAAAAALLAGGVLWGCKAGGNEALAATSEPVIVTAASEPAEIVGPGAGLEEKLEARETAAAAESGETRGGAESSGTAEDSTAAETGSDTGAGESREPSPTGSAAPSGESQPETEPSIVRRELAFSGDFPYGEFSAIHTGTAVLYENRQENAKGITVCVNAGHGCAGGESKKTYCHPDKTPKVTSGSTSAGAVKASAISGGMTFSDGTPEAEVTLSMALILKERLLEEGYSVLMVRETADSQLDNIARTLMANHYADCHIALHWDSTTSDKGVFFMSVPSAASYRAMEPVASHWEKHNALGRALVEGLRGRGHKVFGKGEMEMDLTQTSYSTVPSVDIELGDKKSDHGETALKNLAEGLVDGLEMYFGAAE